MYKSVCVLLCVVSMCDALICLDGLMCDEGNTCCLKASGGYGCCPLPNAECCSDHLHCCYEGTLCDLVHFKCVNKTHTLDWVKRVPAQQSSLPRAVVCPDQESECPDGTTCCQLPAGAWGCCPMPNAVCCEDKRHCCPQNTTCDLEHTKCVSPTLGSTSLWRKLPARPRTQGKTSVEPKVKFMDSTDVQCPDKSSTCPDGTTCCPLGNGTYGCCPMPKAVCCSDHLHCCPAGTTCDLIHGTCISANEIKALPTKMPSVLPQKITVPCNESVTCESGSTCCKRKDGDWACCPLPEAVCCEDHIHCCPHDTVCDLSEGTCDNPADPLTSDDWVEKVPAFHFAPRSSNQKCDSSVSCPDGATCCKMVSGAWGCCPLPQAVCCEDHLHCCPINTVCNVAAGTCDSVTVNGAHMMVPWVTKTPSTPLLPQNTQCDDTFFCLRGTTCCRQKSGAWACCPLPQAVCCDDLQHCCPQGYKCAVSIESCEHPSLPSKPWVEKHPAMSITQHSHTNVNANTKESDLQRGHRCDERVSCPRDNTCCYMTKLDKWGCCPLPQAVCCGDGDHCCPNGYTCDEKKPTCVKGRLEIPWFTKKEAKVTWGSEVTQGLGDVKCDPTTSCAAGSTCCRLPTGHWGCCPLVKAVCCEDLEHCCPQGYTCELQAGTCIKPSALPALTLPLMRMSSAKGEENVRCGGTSSCSKAQTCCRISGTVWTCCPFKQAVCCNDMKHCCPMGYICDTKTKGCTRVSSLTWWDNSV